MTRETREVIPQEIVNKVLEHLLPIKLVDMSNKVTKEFIRQARKIHGDKHDETRILRDLLDIEKEMDSKLSEKKFIKHLLKTRYYNPNFKPDFIK